MKINEKPFVIPVFIPQEGCPHQCVFCNQEKITGITPRLPTFAEINAQVDAFLGYAKEKPGYVQLAFYGGNFLGLEKNAVKHFLEISESLRKKGKIQALRFSTRPDTITRNRLEMLNGDLVYAIELGVQSMCDDVLETSRRGHTAKDTKQAVELLKSLNFQVGLQMMVGLPGDTEERALATVRKIIDLSPDFVRIYPAVVLSKSLLGRWHEKGKYTPLSLSSAVTLSKKIWLMFNAHHIPVVRMGLQPSEELNKSGTILAGPYHPSFGQLVYSEICLDRLIGHMALNTTPVSDLCIRIHPKNASNVRGMKNQNLKELKEKHHVSEINIIADSSMPENMMEVNNAAVKLWEAITHHPMSTT